MWLWGATINSEIQINLMCACGTEDRLEGQILYCPLRQTWSFSEGTVARASLLKSMDT